jgi:hypothetical protein
MKTTLNKIRSHSPCGLNPKQTPLTGFCKLRAHLGEGFDPDQPFSILTVLKSNGLDDALWCLRAVDGYDKEKRLLAVDFARQVQHLMRDPRSLHALDVAERFANGLATKEELDATRSVYDAYDAAAAAAYADAAAAVYDAATRAARAARAAARAAAYAAAREYQKSKLIEVCNALE